MQKLLITIGSLLFLSSCSYYSENDQAKKYSSTNNTPANYSSRLPQHISSGEKTILIDPNVHAWGAYDASGNLIRSGLATAGNDWCPDINRACRTRSGVFRIQSLGGAGCKSTIYPLPRGERLCHIVCFFNGNQGLHGSPYVVEGNVSHGCVRLHVSDAEWVRFNFANIGTRVIVRPY